MEVINEIKQLPGVIDAYFVGKYQTQLCVVFNNGKQLLVSGNDGYGYNSPIDIEVEVTHNNRFAADSKTCR